MSGRDGVRMDTQELDTFLRANIKVQVATAGKDGRPHLTTLFYIVLDDGRIAFWTYGRSQKLVNLERDPRITCLVEDGVDYFELRGASITGSAEIVREPARILAIGAAVAAPIAGAGSAETTVELP